MDADTSALDKFLGIDTEINFGESGINIENTRKDTSNDQIEIRRETEKWDEVKSHWINVICYHGEQCVRPKDSTINVKRPKITNLNDEFAPEINRFFINHLLLIHEKFCKQCFKESDEETDEDCDLSRPPRFKNKGKEKDAKENCFLEKNNTENITCSIEIQDLENTLVDHNDGEFSSNQNKQDKQLPFKKKRVKLRPSRRTPKISYIEENVSDESTILPDIEEEPKKVKRKVGRPPKVSSKPETPKKNKTKPEKSLQPPKSDLDDKNEDEEDDDEEEEESDLKLNNEYPKKTTSKTKSTSIRK